MKKFTRTGKKALSVFLAALMVMTAWVFVAPTKAEAVTAGKYKIAFAIYDNDNGSDGIKTLEVKYKYKTNNGTGTESSEKTTSANADGARSHVKNKKDYYIVHEDNVDGFPSYVYAYSKVGNRQYPEFRIKVLVAKAGNANYTQNNTPAGWKEICDFQFHHKDFLGSNTGSASTTSFNNKPTVSSLTLTGGSTTLEVPKSGSAANSSVAFVGTVYDQYGVVWWKAPTLTSNYTTKIDFPVSDNSGVIEATNEKSNASNNYDVTVTASFSGLTSQTKTCKIIVFDYNVTFKNHDGTVLSGPSSYDYNKTPTAPSTNPTRSPDANNHYTFAGWSPTPGALTTGDQNKVYTAQYKAEAHNFVWKTDKEPTCTATGLKHEQCTVCGYKRSENTTVTKKNHTYGAAATCTTPQTCTVCGTQLNPALGHDFSSKTDSDTYLKSAATCVNDAVYYYKCSRCNESSKNHDGTTWTKTGTALGHKFSVKNTDTKYRKSEADCINAAEYYYKCERCDESSKGITDTTFTDGNALGHNWDTGVVTKEQKCTETGIKKYTCSRCRTTKEETLPVLGHLWDNGTVTTSPTCEGAGVRTFVCQRDSSHKKTESINPNGHTWNTVYTTDKKPTCTEKGSESIHCAKCDAIQAGTSRDINPIGHDWGNWVTTVEEDCINAGSETRTCKRNSTHTETRERAALGHNYAKEFTVDVAPTCTEKGSKSRHCTRCDVATTEVTEIPANGHKYSDWIVDTDSTCYSEGTQHRECTVCHVTLETKPVEKKNHTWPVNWTITKAATCTEKGRKEKRCTVEKCKALLIEEETPANGHTDGEWIIDKSPSCTETGKKHQICAVCKETIKEETIGQSPHTLVHEHQNATCTENGYDRNRCSVCNGISDEKILEKLGHDPKVVSDTQPSCYYDGLYKVVCSREGCGAILETEVRPKLGHIYDKGTRYPANCTMGEYIEYVCTRSGCTEDEPGHKMTEVFSNLEALGHDWSAWTPVKGKEPTCTEVGEEERSCQRKGCTAHETRPLSKLGHNMKAGEAVEASCLSGAYTPYTCSNDGCDFSYRIYDDSKPATDHKWVTTTSQEGNVLTVTCECSVCHKTHTKQVTVDEVHNYSVVSEVKAATCKEAGKIKITCDGAHKAGCTEFIEVETPVNANAHNYETKKVDATCKTEGYVLSKCSICGNEIKTTLPTTAHAWNEGVETTPATCTETGVKTFTCSICGDTYTEVIAQVQHNFKLVNTVAPTCKDGGKSGYKVYKCSTCTATYNEITDDAISHKWSDWTVVQKATDKLCGIEKSTCSVCGEEQLRTTDPIGDHNFVEDIATKKAATCTEDGSVTMKCTAHTDCGVTYEKVLPKLGHDMVAGEPVAATCEHEGYTDYKCSRCTHSYRIVTEAKKAHTLETKTEAASCLDPSVTYTYCTACNKLMGEVTVGQALGHEFTIEVSYKAPTNTKNGEKVLKCSHCTETITVVIPAEGHKFELVSTKEATCAETGLETYKCTTHTDCGLSYTNVIPMKAHTYATRVKTPANCVNAGVGEYYCTVCNEVFGEYDIAALGHDFSKVTETVPSTCNTVGYVTKQCSRCDETETTYSSTLADHSWGELRVVQTADETHPGIKVKQCSVCKLYEYEYTAPTGNHKWNEGVVTTPATCTTEGTKTYTCVADGTCACTADKKATYTETIPATGHTAKVDVKEATCTEAGYVKAVCEICHTTLDEKTLEKKEHIYQSEVTTEPTCSQPGVRTFTCALCGDTYTEQIEMVSHDYQPTGEFVVATCTSPKYETYRCTYGCGAEQLVKVGEANGHTVDESKTKTVPATCTTAGSVSKYCSCGQLLSVEVLGPAEHTWETVTVKLPKECDGSKVTYEKCSVCGVIKAESLNITENGNHEYVVTTETAATCTTPGKLVITCKNCENINVKVEVPAVGHTYDDGVLTEGTCKTDGNVTFTCTRDGCTDAQTGHTITKNIGTKNHKYVESGAPTPATCTSSGYQLYKCEYCGKEFKEILEVPASHVYEKQSTSIEPNCYKSGHYIFKCKNCTASYEYDLPATGNHEIKSEVTQKQSCTLPEMTKYTCATEDCPYEKTEITKSPLGHSFSDDWKVTKEPNEETGENGEQVRSCTRSGCDATETAPIPAKIHNWGETPIATTDASCTEAATETYKCTGCDLCNETNGYKTYVKTIGVPLQHNVVVDYTAPTCTKEGKYVATCTLCGKEFANETLPATGHSFNTYLQESYVPATCREEGSVTYACSNKDCNETQVLKLDVNPNAHKMVEDTNNSKKATCTEAGYKAYKCENQGCDHKYMELIENPVPHVAKDTWTVVKPATCSSNGYEVLECKNCHAIMETREIKAIAHAWITVSSTNAEPTCTESSYSYKKCSVCGAVDESSAVIKNALGHDFSKFVEKKDATATESGYVIYKCSRDGCEETLKSIIPASGHNFTSEVTEEPTCTEKGVRTYTCTVHENCEENYTEEIPALGHKAGDVVITKATCLAEGSAVVNCTVCNAELHNKTLEKLPHTFNDTKKEVVPATCQKTGSITYTCTTDGCTAKLVYSLDKTLHDYKFDKSVPATCIDSGYDVYTCSVEGCDASYNKVTKSANGHNFVEDTARTVDPTCSTVGHKYFKCSACGKDGYDYEVPATGKHNYTETVKVDPTCETAGYSYKKCSECDAVDKNTIKAIDPLGHDYSVDNGDGTVSCSRTGCDSKITVEKFVTEEDGTVHAFEGKITKQSTCKKQGTIEYTCRTHKNCAKNHSEALPFAEHSATAASIIKTEPACKADGSLTNGSIVVKCSVCGTQIGETVIIPAAHKYKVVKVERATCSSKGKVTEQCEVCGYEKVTELEMDATAHDFNSTASITVAATCEADGYEVYNCKHCDAQKFVKTGEKLNHKRTETTTKDATCQAEGYVRIICQDCKKLIEETIIEKTEHTPVTVKVKPDCVNGGSITTKCSVCGKLLEDIVYTPANGHSWGDWVVISGGTCEVEGKRQRKCKVCGEVETISTGAGEHVYPENGVVTEPTCTEDGYTTYTCTICHKHSIVKDYTPKKGHNYSSDYKIYINPTCHSTGAKAHYCINCGTFEPDYQHKYVEIPKLNHDYGDWTVTIKPTCDQNGVKVRTCLNEGCPEGYEGHVQKEFIPKEGHNYGEWTVTKYANCTETGIKERTCDRCKHTETAVIEKGSHKTVVDNAVEATCTSTGLTAGNHCEICGAILVAQKVIPMKAHMDLNGDGKCDECSTITYQPGKKDTCLCHKTGLGRVFYKIALVFWKLFRIKQTCVCGAKHW